MDRLLTTVIALLFFLTAALGQGSNNSNASSRDANLVRAAELTNSVVKLYREEKFKEALPLAKEVLELRTKHLSDSEQPVRSALDNLAELNIALRRHREAKEFLERIVNSFGPTSTDLRLSSFLARLAVVQYASADLSAAEDSYKRAVQVREAVHSSNHAAVAEMVFLLAEFYQFTGKHKEAEPLYQRLVSFWEIQPSNKEKLTEALDRYSCLLRKTRREDEAKILEARMFGAPASLPAGRPEKAIEGGVLNGRAISIPRPSYPPEARAAGASGTVVVRVVIGEDGRVLRACAMSGPSQLLKTSELAAHGARFTPTKLSGQPVTVTGVITYRYVHR